MASLFALAGGRNRVNTYSGLPNPRPIALATASGSQVRQAVQAVVVLPDAADQHASRLDIAVDSGNQVVLNHIPSVGIANDTVNVIAAVPPVPATQTPSRRMRDGQPILPIAEHSPSMTNSAAELPRDVVGDDAMEASDGELPAKRSRSGAPQAAAAAVGVGPSSVSRPRKHSKRGGFGGRGYGRGGRQGHQQGRGGNGSGGGANQPPMSPDQERELTQFYNRYGCQMTCGELRDLRKEAGGNVCYCCRSSAHSYDECTLHPAEARAAVAQGNGH
ncbi:hypothetical protein Vafri_10509 [Volvox africanus]|uniref:Uncharacterized protein n=2 Tax=Volvox africanus TaxID=51714 RepID=A0A8J4BAE0_9CHLO|nr:hypothetical protein Vafri_10509 [Volvox africanus]